MAAQLVTGLSILVILHELGHFIAAKSFGIKVEKFFLFFDAGNFKLFSFKKGNTEYGIGWLPLGGYVKIAGMIDESMDKEQLKKPPQPWEFRSKPAWQRLIVMIAGVVVNLILGIIIFASILFHYDQYLPNKELNNGIYAYKLARDVGFKTGDKIYAINDVKVVRFKDIQSLKVIFGSTVTVKRNNSLVNIEIPDTFYKNFKKAKKKLFIEPLNFPFTIDSVIHGMNAEKDGLKKGDKILSVDSTKISSWGKFTEIISNNKGKKIFVKVERHNKIFPINLTVDSTGLIGIYSSPAPYTLKNYTYSSSLKYGYKDAYEMLAANIKGFGKIFKGEEKASDSLQGPIGIATIYGGVWNWHRFWFITGLLSLILAFMNILPIPALDGGHVFFLTIEAITRRKIPDKFMEYAQITGMIILIAIMIFAVGNDIMRLLR